MRRYRVPTTPQEAVDILAEPGSRVVAGGLELARELGAGGWQGTLVSTQGLEELQGVALTADGGLRIGAAATHLTIERHATVRSWSRDIASVARRLGSIRVRAQGTIGGNLGARSAHHDWPPVLTAIGARLVVRSADGTAASTPAQWLALPADRARTTLLEAVELPAAANGWRLAHMKLGRHGIGGEPALVSATVVGAPDADHGRGASYRIVLAGMPGGPLVLEEAAGHLVGLEGEEGFRALKGAISGVLPEEAWGGVERGYLTALAATATAQGVAAVDERLRAGAGGQR